MQPQAYHNHHTPPAQQSIASCDVPSTVPTLDIFDGEYQHVYSVPKQYVSHVPPEQLCITRLVVCRNYVPGVRGACDKGSQCKFVHVEAPLMSFPKQQIHVNYATKSPAYSLYPCHDAGLTVTALAPNAQLPAISVPSEHLLVTKGSRAAIRQLMLQRQQQGASTATDEATPITTTRNDGAQVPISYCAHYTYKNVCLRGAECYFLHGLYIDESVGEEQFKRAPGKKMLVDHKKHRRQLQRRAQEKNVETDKETADVAPTEEVVHDAVCQRRSGKSEASNIDAERSANAGVNAGDSPLLRLIEIVDHSQEAVATGETAQSQPQERGTPPDSAAVETHHRNNPYSKSVLGTPTVVPKRRVSVQLSDGGGNAHIIGDKGGHPPQGHPNGGSVVPLVSSQHRPHESSGAFSSPSSTTPLGSISSLASCSTSKSVVAPAATRPPAPYQNQASLSRKSRNSATWEPSSPNLGSGALPVTTPSYTQGTSSASSLNSSRGGGLGYYSGGSGRGGFSGGSPTTPSPDSVVPGNPASQAFGFNESPQHQAPRPQVPPGGGASFGAAPNHHHPPRVAGGTHHHVAPHGGNPPVYDHSSFMMDGSGVTSPPQPPHIGVGGIPSNGAQPLFQHPPTQHGYSNTRLPHYNQQRVMTNNPYFGNAPYSYQPSQQQQQQQPNSNHEQRRW